MGKSENHIKPLFVVSAFLLLLVVFWLGFFTNKKHDIVPAQTKYSYRKIESMIPKKMISPSGPLRIPIVLYHYIEHVKDRGDTIRISLDIVPETFDVQLKELANNQYKTEFVKVIPRIISGEIPYHPKMIFLTFDDGYEDFYTDAFPILKKYNAKATMYIVENFIGKSGYMNEKQIKEIVNSGLVELGAHTLNHLSLKSLNAISAKKEIQQSKIDLEKRFGVEIKTFAYPYGAFNDQAIALVKESSFSAAVTTLPGIEQSAENLFVLNRIRAGVLSGPNMISKLENYQKK